MAHRSSPPPPYSPPTHAPPTRAMPPVDDSLNSVPIAVPVELARVRAASPHGRWDARGNIARYSTAGPGRNMVGHAIVALGLLFVMPVIAFIVSLIFYSQARSAEEATGQLTKGTMLITVVMILSGLLTLVFCGGVFLL